MTDVTQELADRIAATYGSRARRSGREYRVFCPVHESDGHQHSPSLAIWPRNHGHPGIACMTGCAWRDVIAALEAKGIEFPRVSSAQAAAEREEAAAAAQAALRRAKQLYAASAPVVEGDPVQRYLEKRHLWPFRPAEDTYLRCTRGRDPGEWLFMSVIVDTLSLGDVDQRAVGAQIMPLDVRGNWKTDDRGKKMRRIIGTRRAVGVPLGKPCETLVVGEGVETTMAALRALDKPFGIAALSAENMSNLLIPQFVRNVTIAQDNDAAGIAAAERCAPMWRQQGLVVRVASFGDAGMDAADWLAARKRVTS